MESRVKDIEAYCLVHGHDEFYLPKITEEMAQYMIDLSEINMDEYNVKLPYISRAQVLRAGRDFYETYFKVHDIFYGTERMLKKICGEEVSGYKELLEKFNKIGKRISPYKLPVRFVQGREIKSYVSLLSVDIDDNEFLKGMNPFYKKICLKRFPTILTPVSYIHELGHVEIESNKGIINDYSNSEVLPIFLEFLSLKENDELFKYNLVKRIKYLLFEFDTVATYILSVDGKKGTIYEAFLACKYFVSTVKAIRLLYLYLESSVSVKKEILKEIQKIMDADKKLEELLQKFNITLESSVGIDMVQKMLVK